ncbi:MAG: cytochrome C oxidase assembly protein [Thermoprotei archaeon]
MLLEVLGLIQAVMAAGIIVVGGIVEGYGYGLSLGTNWPYTRSMPKLAKGGDPEVWHRILATLLGINSVIILVVHPGILEITGFILIVLTALLGMATLYVLAGKAPSFFQGFHDVLAYLTLLNYLLVFSDPRMGLGGLLLTHTPLHSFFFAIFMGGFVTGQRGYQKPIGHFVTPRTSSQWVWVVHGLAALLLIVTLGFYASEYTLAFFAALAQVGVGFLSYEAVNASASKPGVVIPLHQLITILVAVSIFYGWSFSLPLLG